MKPTFATILAALSLSLLLAGPAEAQGNNHKKAGAGSGGKKPKVETTDLGEGGKATARDEGTGNKQVKVIDFTGLALSGRIRTPQLLYFLNRIRQELEAVQLEKRSFMPELVRSVNDDAL